MTTIIILGMGVLFVFNIIIFFNYVKIKNKRILDKNDMLDVLDKHKTDLTTKFYTDFDDYILDKKIFLFTELLKEIKPKIFTILEKDVYKKKLDEMISDIDIKSYIKDFDSKTNELFKDKFEELETLKANIKANEEELWRCVWVESENSCDLGKACFQNESGVNINVTMKEDHGYNIFSESGKYTLAFIQYNCEHFVI